MEPPGIAGSRRGEGVGAPSEHGRSCMQLLDAGLPRETREQIVVPGELCEHRTGRPGGERRQDLGRLAQPGCPAARSLRARPWLREEGLGRATPRRKEPSSSSSPASLQLPRRSGWSPLPPEIHLLKERQAPRGSGHRPVGGRDSARGCSRGCLPPGRGPGLGTSCLQRPPGTARGQAPDLPPRRQHQGRQSNGGKQRGGCLERRARGGPGFKVQWWKYFVFRRCL